MSSTISETVFAKVSGRFSDSFDSLSFSSSNAINMVFLLPLLFCYFSIEFSIDRVVSSIKTFASLRKDKPIFLEDC
jgi:hypothetical protein